MKSSKVLTLVAIVSIALTAFTANSNVARYETVDNCYAAIKTQFIPACIPSEVNLSSGSGCSFAINRIGWKVNSLSNFFSTRECDNENSFFCCAQVIVDTEPCTDQKLLNFIDRFGVGQSNKPAKIDAVYCKSTSN